MYLWKEMLCYGSKLGEIWSIIKIGLKSNVIIVIEKDPMSLEIYKDDQMI